MEIKWTKQALEGFQHIQSQYFSPSETKEYKKDLVNRIHAKISILGTSIPSNQQGWEGSFKIIIDKYIVYYSFSNDHSICYIEYFKHIRQKN
ncbi:type II toxin-antitoxin system RelE/ParE family toxin [Pseudoneobacillus sp. C159]